MLQQARLVSRILVRLMPSPVARALVIRVPRVLLKAVVLRQNFRVIRSVGAVPPDSFEVGSDLRAPAGSPGASLERLVVLQERVQEMRADLGIMVRKFDSLHGDLVHTLLVATSEQLERAHRPVSAPTHSPSSNLLSQVLDTVGSNERNVNSDAAVPHESVSVAGQSMQEVPAVLSEAESLRLRRLEFLNRQQRGDGSRTDES
jgi:hypothetical protein